MRPDARVQAAIEILERVLMEVTPADKIIADYFRKRRYAGSKDRRAVGEQVFSVLRHASELLWRGAELKARDLVRLDLLRQGTTGAELGALFSGVGHGPAELTDRELAALADLGEGPEFVRGNYPLWLEDRLRARFADNLVAEMSALNLPAPVDLRVNLLKAGRQEVLDVLVGEGIAATARTATATGIRIDGRVRIVDHPLYRQGQVEIQDEASQIAVAASGALPQQTVVDFGAGAGGKSLALAALMENRGKIHALDVSAARLKRLLPRVVRAGAEIVSPVQIGDREDDPWLTSHQNIADLVFLDAPCSGTGTWRRQVEQRLRLTPAMLQDYVDLQARVLARAWGLVKPGGMLGYATCSILLEEDELQVRRFLLENENAEMAAGTELVLTPWRNDCDGFFLAMIRKSA